MTQDQIDELFDKSLAGDYDDDAQWEAVATLQRIGTRQVLDRAAEWCSSTDQLRRARGADVLAQIGRTAERPRNAFPEESYSIVSQLVQRETDLLPLIASIHALGHIGNPLAIPLMIEKYSHENKKVRFAVACALGTFAGDSRAVEALMALTKDSDEDVRDWATFGLGVLGHVDSPEIRESLLKLTSDPSSDVREEALVGLANRKESRAIPALIAELNRGALSSGLGEAAELFLGTSEHHDEWGAHDFAEALRQRFSV